MIDKNNSDVWTNALFDYFTSIGKDVVRIPLKNSSIKITVKSTKKTNDFTISVYPSTGTVTIQTKQDLVQNFRDHLANITNSTVPPLIDQQQTIMRIRSTPSPYKSKRIRFDVPCNAEVVAEQQDIDQAIFNENIEQQTLSNEKIIQAVREDIYALFQENVRLNEKIEKNSIDSTSWIEKRYEMLRSIPQLTEQNSSLMRKNGNYESAIRNLNTRVNELEKEMAEKNAKIESLQIAMNNSAKKHGVVVEQLAITQGVNTNLCERIFDLEQQIQWNDRKKKTGSAIHFSS